jgi:hypothetical protein
MGISKRLLGYSERHRLVKGAYTELLEYIPELRTEPETVGCGGFAR